MVMAVAMVMAIGGCKRKNLVIEIEIEIEIANGINIGNVKF